MNAYARLHLAATANAEASESHRRGAPTLQLDSDPTVLVAWLMWCDPNGCHLWHVRGPACEAKPCECYDVHSDHNRCGECGTPVPCRVCYYGDPAYETVDEVWGAIADMLEVDLSTTRIG
jgi:hypothetical protein